MSSNLTLGHTDIIDLVSTEQVIQKNYQPGLRSLLRQLNMADTIDKIAWLLLELPD